MGYLIPGGYLTKLDLEGDKGRKSARLEFTADSDFLMSGQRIVANSASGLVYADNSLLETVQLVLGMTKTAGQVDIPIIGVGEYIDSTMNWDPELPLWLGVSGQITQIRPVKPAALYLLEVGKVIAPTVIYINIKQPVILA